jgi:TrmH family RNA methyltransferase
LLAEAVETGSRIDRVFAVPEDADTRRLCEDAGIPVMIVTEPALERMAGTTTPRGPMAVMHIPEQPTPPEKDVLIAWGVSDPGNVGMLIRVAAAFGWAFGYTPGTSDPWSPKTLRSGAGGHFRSGISRIATLADLYGRHRLASVVAGGSSPRAHAGQGRFALLMGDEGSGLPADVVEACEGAVTIDMPGGTESLNVAVAAGILVYELTLADR